MPDELQFSIHYSLNSIGLRETLELPDGKQYSPIQYDKDKLSLLPAWVDRTQPNYSIYLMDCARNEPLDGGWTYQQRFDDYCNRLPDVDPEEVLKIMFAPSGNLNHLKDLAISAVITP